MNDNDCGWVKIHRKMLFWEWYDDNNMVRVFLHLILKANFEARNWRGTKIERGQLITSISELSRETNLSEMQVRTCLDKLLRSGEINKQTTNKFTKITICNYASYQQTEQTNNKQSNKQITNKQQTNNKQITTTKEYKEIKESKELQEIESNTLTRKSQFENWLTTNCPYIAKHYTLPTDEQLEKLCDQYGAQLVAETTQQIENRADLRKRYTNLYRTLLNWLKRETDKSMSYDERERQKRLATYANVAEQFLNGEIRNDIPIPFGLEH